MSIKVMTDVWEHSQAHGTPLLVLLCLADFADDDGECWPAIGTIGKKCRLKDARHVQRVIRELEQLGEVVVIIGAGKSSSKGGVRSNRYRITVHLPDATPVEGPGSAVGDPGSQTTLDPGSQTTQTPVEGPPEPSVTHQLETSSVPAVPKTPRRRSAQIAEDFAVTHEMREWCTAKSILSDPMVETEKFVNHHRSRGSVFADPIAAWRNWMIRADEFSKSGRTQAIRSRSLQAVDSVLGSVNPTRQEALPS